MFITILSQKTIFLDMKKVILSVFSLVFLAAMISCEKNDNAGGTKAAETVKVDSNATPTNPPVDKEQQKADSLPKTTVKWAEESYDFKKIKEGEKVSHKFLVENTGQNDLFLTKVKPSCGCTATSFTQEAIKPGTKGFVDIEFNSAGKNGTQQKSITVTGNFEGGTQKVLKFTGEVMGKEKPAEGGEKKADEHKH